MTNKTTTSKAAPKKLTAHGLLGSISYWGTASRFFLVSMLIGFAYALNLSSVSSSFWQYFDSETIYLLFGLTTILILDIGYVVASRALPLSSVADRWMVMMSDLVLAGFFVAPSLVVIGANSNQMRIISLLAALLVVSIRILVGLLFAKRK